MSYDIDLYLPGADYEAASMNWLRNSFGLCEFAEDNVGDGERSLYHVCNDHAYSDVKDLDRAEFLRVVSAYWDRLRRLEKAHFYFTFGSYVQFAGSYHGAMVPPRGHDGSDYIWDGKDDHIRFAVDVTKFQRYGREHFSWGSTPVLEFYKEWFQRLVDLAEKMQDPKILVNISN